MSHHLNAVRAAFSAQAADFSRPGLTVTDPHHLGWMLASLELDPAWSVLDVAAGTGLLSLAIAPQVRQVLALDATPAMIREGTRAVAAAGPTRITFVNGLAENLPAAAGAFDLVACRFAIHHFKDPRRPVSDMLRVCRAGGRIALVDLIASDDTRLAQSYNHFERLRDPSHTRAFAANRTGSVARRLWAIAHTNDSAQYPRRRGALAWANKNRRTQQRVNPCGAAG